MCDMRHFPCAPRGFHPNLPAFGNATSLLSFIPVSVSVRVRARTRMCMCVCARMHEHLLHATEPFRPRTAQNKTQGPVLKNSRAPV